MIKQIDELLLRWGLWADAYGPGRGGQTMNYRPRGVMSTNPDPDDPVAQYIDRILAGIPQGYQEMQQAKKLIRQRYLYGWPREDTLRNMDISLTKYKSILQTGHVWVLSRLEAWVTTPDGKKIVDEGSTANYAFPRILREVTPRENEQTPEPA